MKFEDFIYTKNGNDLFEKANEVDELLKSGVMTGNEGLGIKLVQSNGARAKIKEKNGSMHDVIMLGSNSYLSLTNHPKVCEASKRALEKFGYGMGAVSVYAGTTELHQELEQRIANFYGCEDAVVFPSGYGTNVGVISALCNKGDVIINDSANHASIFDGSKLSGAEVKVFPHGNMEALERILSKIDDSISGRLIVTDGVFSMYGDVAKLDKIVELAKKYKARVMVDDAHGLGVVGPTGRGTAEIFGLNKEIDLNVGMLSKAPGSIGGYCACSRKIAQYLRLYARSYFFSTAIPAPTIAGLIEVFKLFEHDRAGRSELWKNIKLLKDKLSKAGFSIGESQSGIIPIIIGDEPTLFKMYQDLRLSGVYTNIVTYPAVRRKECRIRICASKNLNKDEIERAVEIITTVGKKYSII